MRRPPKGKAAGAALPLALGWAAPAFAHGLGQRYDLPIPLSLYLAGAAAVVALSFVVLAIFARRPADGTDFGIPRIALLRWRPERAPLLAIAATLVRMLAVAAFALIVAAALVGNQDPFKNIAPVSVWVVWWVGMAYLSALLGNVWMLLNPWSALFGWAEAVARRLRPGPRPPRTLRWPRRLGAWPAAALFLAFAWAELVWPDRDRPAALGTAILLYSVIAWTGMALFGRRRWLEGGEAFSVAFGLLARFAVTAVRSDGKTREWILRLPAAGLLVREPVHPSLTAFALLMLATVTFDGFLDTPLWVGMAEAALASPALTGAARAIGAEPYVVLATLALAAFPALFAGAYLIFARLTALAAADRRPGGDRPATAEMAGLFVLTLVPIAIAYHLAHYLSYLLVAGQFIIPLASDPFGFGWDLFGTTLYLIDIGIVDARFVWYASVAAIVAGHVIAVWLAHLVAARRFRDPGRARRSQYPMLVLMVGYTAVSLWILAQPIVTEPAGG